MALGIRYMAVSAFFYSIMSLQVKAAGARLPSQEIVLVRSVVLAIGSWALLRRKGLSPAGVRRGLLVTRGVLGFTALSCFFFALTRLPLADATVIHHMNPVFTALLAALLLGERISARAIGFVALSLAGVILIARPGFIFGTAGGLDPLGVAVGMAGALFSAAAFVTVRKLGATDEPLVIVFYFAVISTVASVPIVVPIAMAPTAGEWALLLGVGLATLLAQIAVTHGLTLAPAGRASAIGYLQIVFAALWGIIFFREFPDAVGVLGALLIVVGTLGIARRRESAPLISANGTAGATRPRGIRRLLPGPEDGEA